MRLRLSSRSAYTTLIGLVAVERLAELALSRRHAAQAFANGGVERGQRHYPVMVALHTGLLAGCLLETWAGRAPYRRGLGVPMLGVTLASQALRWWCISTLGQRWNTRVIVVPGAPLVRQGPYRHLDHPNYVAVVAEGLALPLVHGAWRTAGVFTALNLPLLAVRIRTENAALGRVATALDPGPTAQ